MVAQASAYLRDLRTGSGTKVNRSLDLSTNGVLHKHSPCKARVYKLPQLLLPSISMQGDNMLSNAH